MRLRRVIAGLVFAVLLASVALLAGGANALVTQEATGSPGRPPDHNGWYNAPVTINFNGDPGDTCDSVRYDGPDGRNVQVTGTCTGPLGSYSGTYTLDYDATQPSVSVTFGRPPDRNGWYNAAVVYQGSGNGGASGIDTCSSDVYNGPNDAAVTVRATCTDNAGNSAADTAVLKYDETPPTVNVVMGRNPDFNGWYNGPVVYRAEMQDGMSGAGSCDPPGTYNGPDDPSATVRLSCTDAAGNSATGAATFSYDSTPPELTFPSLLPQEATGPWGAPVPFIVTATDPAKGSQPPSDLIPSQIACAPQSGAVFPLGPTTVQCTATDDARNQRSGSFGITVADRTSPAFTVHPQDIVVQARNADTGTPASNPCIQKFLKAPAATDLVDGQTRITRSGTRNRYPLGDTRVTFSTRDAAGNPPIEESAIISVRLGGQGDCTIDAVAPPNVRKLVRRALDKRVVLRWKRPAATDFRRVSVWRSRTNAGALEKLVYNRRRSWFIDRGLANRIVYRYHVVSVDRAGNKSRGVFAYARPNRYVLLAPWDGARRSQPPMLRWMEHPRASYYNMQLLRYLGPNRLPRKILSIWPRRNHHQLKRQWRYAGHVRRLSPGRYIWYVWPGFGSLSAGNYGNYMGPGDFTMVRRR